MASGHAPTPPPSGEGVGAVRERRRGRVGGDKGQAYRPGVHEPGAASREALTAAWARLISTAGGRPDLLGAGPREHVGPSVAVLPGDAAVDRIEVISALEDLKDAACALQAELAVDVVRHEVTRAERAAAAAVDPDAPAAVRARARERTVRRARRSAVGQIALARRDSPHRGGVLVGAAEALVAEMPCTLAALRAGAVDEHRAVLLVRETACLDRESRARVDREIAGDLDALAGMGARRLIAATRQHAYRLDPASFVRRAERSATERNVTLRPAPGSMAYLTALLPLAQGVGVLAALQRAAESARATGDERAKGQIMADTLVERATGQGTADAVPVAVNLIMSDESLLAAGHEPAILDGAHAVPAQLGRELVARGTDPRCETPAAETEAAAESSQPGERIGAWVRRLYTDVGGNLVAMDSRTRMFPRGLAALLRVRDQGLCRTPWCDAPVAHTDHITPVVSGGATAAENGQGLCAGCNYTKQAPGWVQRTTDREEVPGQHGDPPGPARVRLDKATRHRVVTTTPTGHTCSSTAPPLPAPRRAPGPKINLAPQRHSESPVEVAFQRALSHAA